MSIRRRSLVFLGLFCGIASHVFAEDDAEVLSRRVPKQRYYVVSDTGSALQRGNGNWLIPLWACDPETLTIIKVIGGSAPAPYAIRIATRPNNPISELSFSGGRTLPAIHLLAASLEDAKKMRRALVKEIESMQRAIERRQGNPPGHLKKAVRSQKR
jgi:hypothetical protein